VFPATVKSIYCDANKSSVKSRGRASFLFFLV
jgi:hypothetical protein